MNVGSRIIPALVLNDYLGAHYATMVYEGIKKIETRMGRLFSHRGDLVICCGAKSVTENAGLALCIVDVFHGRPMIKSDEKDACIEWHPNRKSLLLQDWRYFSRNFKFAEQAVKRNFQGVFSIEIPADVKIIPQPHILPVQTLETDLFSNNNTRTTNIIFYSNGNCYFGREENNDKANS